MAFETSNGKGSLLIVRSPSMMVSLASPPSPGSSNSQAASRRCWLSTRWIVLQRQWSYSALSTAPPS